MDISRWFCLVKTFITYTLRNSAVLFFIWPRFVDFFYIRTEELCRHTGDPLCVYPLLIKLKSESRHLYLVIVHIFCSGMPPCNVDIKRRPFFSWQLNKKTHNSLISDKWSMSYGHFFIEKLSSQVMAISCISCTLS